MMSYFRKNRKVNVKKKSYWLKKLKRLRSQGQSENYMLLAKKIATSMRK